MIPKKILIVDDEENILYAIELFLSNEGYHVTKARNGKEAIEKYKVVRPDVILLDIMMPEMDGFEVARHVRDLDIKSSTKIIFLTAKGTINDKMRAYQLGGDDYIVKPFKNSSILEKIS